MPERGGRTPSQTFMAACCATVGVLLLAVGGCGNASESSGPVTQRSTKLVPASHPIELSVAGFEYTARLARSGIDAHGLSGSSKRPRRGRAWLWLVVRVENAGLGVALGPALDVRCGTRSGKELVAQGPTGRLPTVGGLSSGGEITMKAGAAIEWGSQFEVVETADGRSFQCELRSVSAYSDEMATTQTVSVPSPGLLTRASPDEGGSGLDQADYGSQLRAIETCAAVGGIASAQQWDRIHLFTARGDVNASADPEEVLDFVSGAIGRLEGEIAALSELKDNSGPARIPHEELLDLRRYTLSKLQEAADLAQQGETAEAITRYVESGSRPGRPNEQAENTTAFQTAGVDLQHGETDRETLFDLCEDDIDAIPGGRKELEKALRKASSAKDDETP